MVRDGVANIVRRLYECGFEPRRVGGDAWRSRCPAHRGCEHALSITRNEFNHVVLACRSTFNCTHINIIRALGFTNDHLYAATPDWLISQLGRVEIQPSIFATHDAVYFCERRDVTLPARGLSRHHPTFLAEEVPNHLGTAGSGDHQRNEREGPCLRRAKRPSGRSLLVTETTAVDTGQGVADRHPDAAGGHGPRVWGIRRPVLCGGPANGRGPVRELKRRHCGSPDHPALKATGKFPRPEAISAVVGALEAIAEFEGVHADVFLRVVRGPGGLSYFLDLADRDGWIIEIRPMAGARPVTRLLYFCDRRAARSAVAAAGRFD